MEELLLFRKRFMFFVELKGLFRFSFDMFIVEFIMEFMLEFFTEFLEELFEKFKL